MWAILIITLPTRPNAVRLRIWRALKNLGCAALRDGAYLLPIEHAALLEPLASEVRACGGTASVLELSARDAAQQAEVLVQFDRTEGYTQWRATATALRADVANLNETQARRRLRGIADALHSLRGIDYYPGPAAAQAEADLQALRETLDASFSKGEPQARAGNQVARLERAKFRGRRWATRARPWVDRLACAWLIRRFIDPQAKFVWLSDRRAAARTPPGVLGFDYDGARFTHIGTRVTFEVMMMSFGLESDVKLQRIAQAVRFLDVGGIPVPEAAGLEVVLAGLRELHADDDKLVAAAATLFDALYAVPGGPS